MATIIAAVGGGNWTAGGTWVGGVAPGTGDDAQLTAASGNVTIDSGAVGRSLDCTGYTGTLTHTGSIVLALGDGTAGAGNVALKLVAGMTYVPGSGTFINLQSTSATQQTVTTAGKTMGNVSFLGPGSSYILGDGLTTAVVSLVTLQQGTFNTGNFACSWGLFNITSGVAKTLTLGSSAIAITGNSATAVNVTGSGTTFTANTAVMTLSGASAGLVGAFNWNGLSLVFTNTVTDARLVTGPTVANVTYNSPATKTGGNIQAQGGNPTITGTLTLTGNSTVNRILFKTNTTGTVQTVTVTTGFSFTNVDFQDITAAGAAGTWTGTSMGNALGNTNITFDPAATQTRSGAGGNYSTAGSWTSRVPLPQDNVVIGAGASGTITMDMPRMGADIDFTGFTGTASFASVANTLYGSLNLASGMTISGTQTLTLAARSSKTITSNGKAFTQNVTIIAPGGSYTLQDAMTGTTTNLVHGGAATPGGTFDTNGQTLTVISLNSQGTGTTLTLGTSTVSLTTVNSTGWLVGSAGNVFNGGSSTITFNSSAGARIFAGGGKTYGTLTYTVAGSTGSLTITGANTFGTLNFSDASNARSLLFTAATTTTITTLFNVVGTAGNLMTIDSATAATHTLSKAGGIVSTDFVSVKNSIATGGAAWYAGTHSTDAGGNTGWQFIIPPTANFTGTGTLTGVGAPNLTGTAAFTGTGTLTATATPSPTGIAAFTGTGTLTSSVASLSLTGLAALNGTGTLTGVGSLVLSGTATFTGTGTLTAVTTPRLVGTAAFTGAGTLTSTSTAELTGRRVEGKAMKRVLTVVSRRLR